MVKRTVRGRVGRQRLSKSVNPIEQKYTRQIRKQMEEIERNLSKFINDLSSVTPKVLDDALRPTFEKSQELVPVRTGSLKESGFLVVERSGTEIKAEMGYAKGGEPDYAVFVHERTDLNHAHPTQAKFLQTPLEQDADAIPERILASYKSNTKI